MIAVGSVGYGTKVTDMSMISPTSHNGEHSWDHDVDASQRTHEYELYALKLKFYGTDTATDTNTDTDFRLPIPNGHPREEKRASDKSPRTIRRGSSRALLQADFCARRTRRLPRAEVGEEVCVGVGVRVDPVGFSLIPYSHLSFVNVFTRNSFQNTYIKSLDE